MIDSLSALLPTMLSSAAIGTDDASTADTSATTGTSTGSSADSTSVGGLSSDSFL
jgi:hypothetical protein